jgi:hypothetical protein
MAIDIIIRPTSTTLADSFTPLRIGELFFAVRGIAATVVER